MKPANGEDTIGRNTFQSRPLFEVQPASPAFEKISAPQLLCAADNAAPHRPPINACDDDDGRPRHQVIRFQPIAPSSAQISTWLVTTSTWSLIRPEEIVFATAVPKNAPARLVHAARITACPGDNTLVATTVAIELAVSWKPLMNSNASAASTTTSTRVSMAVVSAVLQHDFISDHAGLAAAVDRLLEDLEELLEQEHLRRVEVAR